MQRSWVESTPAFTAGLWYWVIGTGISGYGYQVLALGNVPLGYEFWYQIMESRAFRLLTLSVHGVVDGGFYTDLKKDGSTYS